MKQASARIALVCAAIALVACAWARESPELAWGYDEQDFSVLAPSKWSTAFEACAAPMQSPIDISSADFNPDVEDLTIHYQCGYKDAIVRNTGKDVRIEGLNRSGKMRIQGGNLTHAFLLDHIRFHWGTCDSCGSEHTFNGKRYPLELQFVHYNTVFRSFQEAEMLPGGLAIVSVIFELGQRNLELEKIARVLKYVDSKDKEYDFDRTVLDPYLLLPSTKDFYFYTGSESRPPCQTSLHRIVFNRRMTVSEAQLNKFRALRSDFLGRRSIGYNFRPLQPLEDRAVEFHKQRSDKNPPKPVYMSFRQQEPEHERVRERCMRP